MNNVSNVISNKKFFRRNKSFFGYLKLLWNFSMKFWYVHFSTEARVWCTKQLLEIVRERRSVQLFGIFLEGRMCTSVNCFRKGTYHKNISYHLSKIHICKKWMLFPRKNNGSDIILTKRKEFLPSSYLIK